MITNDLHQQCSREGDEFFMSVTSPTPKHEHQQRWREDQIVNVSAVIVSDSLSKLDENERKQRDKSTPIIREMLETQQHFRARIITIEFIPDEKDALRNLVIQKTKSFNSLPIHWIIFSGGTGISPRDVTIEAVRPLLEKELPGFGELFRLKTYEQVGTVAIMTRALAGIVGRTLVTCLPGSPHAVRLGLELIIPEIKHLLSLLTR